MRKIYKAFTAITLAGCMLLASCQNFEDLIPEEYGSWENHYVYRGNMRSKTTGEDGEYLVSEVQLDGRGYTVQACRDYAIAGDDIYMCLSLSFASQEVLYSSAVVKYNVLTKTQETLSYYQSIPYQTEGAGTAVSYEAYSIEGLTDEGLLLCGKKESGLYSESGERTEYTNQSAYYYMDFEGNVVGELPYEYYLSYAKGNDTYWWNTKWEDNEWSLYYVSKDCNEPVFVCKRNTADYTYGVTFIEKNGAVGFLIQSYEKEVSGADECRLWKMEFYNLKTNALTTLYEASKYISWVAIPENEYFVAYEYETVTYQYKDKIFAPKKQGSVDMKTHCELYQILYSEEGAKAELMQGFGGRKNMTDIRAVAGYKILAHGIWYADARGCDNGGEESEYVEIDLVKGEKKLTSDEFNAAEDEYFGFYARQTGEACGDYVYYLQKEKLTAALGGTSYAYLLKRYDTKGEKTEVMQLWHESYQKEGEKACVEMWRSMGGDVEEFIVRGY